MSRSWFGVWADRSDVPVLEKNEFCRSSSGDCVRWRCSFDMGLSAAGTWTDAWICDRAVFTGGRICAEYSLHCDLQPLHEETISGDSGRVR